MALAVIAYFSRTTTLSFVIHGLSGYLQFLQAQPPCLFGIRGSSHCRFLKLTTPFLSQCTAPPYIADFTANPSSSVRPTNSAAIYNRYSNRIVTLTYSDTLIVTAWIHMLSVVTKEPNACMNKFCNKTESTL